MRGRAFSLRQMETQGMRVQGVKFAVQWNGSSGWWIIETVESFNGRRYETDMGTFMSWFSVNAFCGSNYSNTPIGAATHVDAPSLGGIENDSIYFGSWAGGNSFAISAWASRNTTYFQAVGDPFVKR
jgi:hypothetical protein